MTFRNKNIVRRNNLMGLASGILSMSEFAILHAVRHGNVSGRRNRAPLLD